MNSPVRLAAVGRRVLAPSLLLLALLPTDVRSQVQPDTLATTFDEEKAIGEIRKKIEGRENEPAGTVFKNVKIFASVPAGRLPMIMKMGYSRSLGVSCTHCHDVSAWESDAKPKKQAAREMAAMVRRLNEEILPSISGLASEKPTVNCTTCHRGEKKPALNMTTSATQR